MMGFMTEANRQCYKDAYQLVRIVAQFRAQFGLRLTAGSNEDMWKAATRSRAYYNEDFRGWINSERRHQWLIRTGKKHQPTLAFWA